jgi:hypothetical protein
MTRMRFDHRPGELAKAGQFWLLDALAPDDLQTGRRLREDLEHYIVATQLEMPGTLSPN